MIRSAAVIKAIPISSPLSPALAANYVLGRFAGDLWSKTLEDPASWIGSTVVWIVVGVRWWRTRRA
jgi:hypothetical protein